MRPYDFLFADFLNVLYRRQFSELLDFLRAHGGLDAVDEHGHTALMELILRSRDTDVHNEFAKKLVEQGCDINRKEQQSSFVLTALSFAVRNGNCKTQGHVTILSIQNIHFVQKLHEKYM